MNLLHTTNKQWSPQLVAKMVFKSGKGIYTCQIEHSIDDQMVWQLWKYHDMLQSGQGQKLQIDMAKTSWLEEPRKLISPYCQEGSQKVLIDNV